MVFPKKKLQLGVFSSSDVIYNNTWNQIPLWSLEQWWLQDHWLEPRCIDRTPMH